MKWHSLVESVELDIVDGTTDSVQDGNPFIQANIGRLLVSRRTASAVWNESAKFWRWPFSTGHSTVDPKEHALLGTYSVYFIGAGMPEQRSKFLYLLGPKIGFAMASLWTTDLAMAGLGVRQYPPELVVIVQVR